MNAPVAYVNGGFLPQSEARVSVLDRGFLFADGVYEVLVAYAGAPFALDRHLRRLARSLRELAIADPLTPPQWRTLCEELIRRNSGGPQDLMLYLQVTRGAMDRRVAAFPPVAAPTVVGFCQPLPRPAAEALADGVAAITVPDIRWGRCDIKAIALLPNVLAIQAAGEKQCNEAILHRGERVTEGASSNVFAVIDGTVVTPPNGPEILPGVTRDLLLELLRGDGQAVSERDLTLTELRGAQEVWVASTAREVLAVTRLDGAKIGAGRPGPVWRRAHELFQQAKKQEAATGDGEQGTGKGK